MATLCLKVYTFSAWSLVQGLVSSNFALISTMIALGAVIYGRQQKKSIKNTKMVSDKKTIISTQSRRDRFTMESVC